MSANFDSRLEEVEISLLLEGVFRRYGYDFRDYAPASLKRRIWKHIRAEQLTTVSGLQERVLHDPSCMERFLLNVSVDVSDMFRDPDFYRSFREQVVPLLRSYPFLRMWHAGCAAGEEVYSMAILLNEEGLLERTRLYATDMNEVGLRTARDGIFPIDAIQRYTSNYLKAGGTRSLSEYYAARYGNIIFLPQLRQKITWAHHNLVTDVSFNEFHVIICRNVMIYFNQSLQNRVHKLLYESLTMSGLLGLGSKESLSFTPYESCYEALDSAQRLYRKVR